jgi:VanZ family protein
VTNSILLVRGAFALTLLFAVQLLWAFLTPVAQMPKAPEISDYIWHISIFAVLVIPLCTTLPKQRMKTAIAAILFGTLIEFIQPYFGRGFQVHDLGANALGVCAGWFLSRQFAHFLKWT